MCVLSLPDWSLPTSDLLPLLQIPSCCSPNTPHPVVPVLRCCPTVLLELLVFGHGEREEDVCVSQP
jgi:hypothetical protein